MKGKEEKSEPEANFALSGKLAAESNTVNGVVLVHQEPPESRKPSQMWRLYGFRNGQCLLQLCWEPFVNFLRFAGILLCRLLPQLWWLYACKASRVVSAVLQLRWGPFFLAFT